MLTLAMRWLWPETPIQAALVLGGYIMASATTVGAERILFGARVRMEQA